MSRGNAIRTFTGGTFWPFDPRPEDVYILDIAHSLSQQCRWGGHCNPFISVAEHCVRVSSLLAPQHALWGLMHDSAEAYLIDVPTPIKRMLPEYNAAEVRVLSAIATAFKLPFPMPQDVHHADAVLKATEYRDLMEGPIAPWVERTEMLSEHIKPWSMSDAKQLFLKRFEELQS